MKKILSALLLSFAAVLNAQELKITYIANEGVLLEAEGKKVLIDALFDDFYEDYLSPEANTIDKMMKSESPFTKVDLVLTTHIHRDHFEVTTTGDFLKNHKESVLLSSNQIKNELTSKYVDFKNIEGRVKSHERGVVTLQDEINGIKVNSFFIYHAGGERTRNIENMGFVVEIGGKRVLHLGDSDMDISRFESLKLAQYNIDIALVPYWYMTSDDGKIILDNELKAKQLIGIHYPKAPSRSALGEIEKQYPKAIVFRKVFETFQY